VHYVGNWYKDYGLRCELDEGRPQKKALVLFLLP